MKLTPIGSMSALSLKLFGYPEVRIGKEEVTGFHSNKSRALLFYLAVTRRPQSRAVLAGMLWADFPEDRAMNNLRKTLSNLRKLAGEFLDIERERVAFDQSSDYWLDVADFEAGLQEFEAGKGSEALERSIALYVGEFLEGFYLDGAEEWENWLLSERRRLRQAYHSALQALAEHHAEQGDFEPAIHFAQKLLNQDSLREDVQRMLMTLYAKNGQRVRALNQYETCRRILKAELSVEPAAETAALHESIRSGAVGPPEKIAPGDTLFPGSGMDYVQPGFLDDETVPVEERRPPFIGRELELAQLDEHLAAALTGEGRIAFVTGEAGRGKSALLAEFTRRAQQRYPDLIAAAGNCNAFSGVGDPFHPFREILDQLCGDVEGRWRSGTITREQATRLWGMIPDTAQALVSEGASLMNLIHSGPALLARAGVFATAEPAWFLRLNQLVGDDGPSRVQPDQLLSQFSAVLGVLAQRHPLLLILDDLQWADSSSLDLLFQLSRNLVGKPILILGAYRPSDAALDPASSESGPTHSIPAIVDELKRRSGQSEIDLGRLSTSAEREFSDALIDREPNRLGEPFRVAFYQRTKGHPLFSIEMLQEMQDRGDLIRDEQGNWIVARQLEWERLPVRVEAVISQRINRLEEELRELLSAASVEGESFTVQLIARLLARDERWVLRQLARLQKEHRLVREISEVEVNGQRLTSYKFKHILFQQYLYEELSQGERRLLHGSIASGLQELYAGQEDDVMLSLAHHYTQAGQPGEAIPYLLAAGDRARTQNAFREALNHYQRALAFLKERGNIEEAARTLMKIGLTYHNASAFDQARAANEEAFRLWQQVGRTQIGGSLPKAPHALRVAGESFSGKLDPAMVKETPRALLMQQLFSGLLRLGQDLELIPDLAHGWEVLDQGRRYLFHLRKEARWSDGAQVTAGDFEFAWKRVLDPATASPNAVDLFDVKGARAFHLDTGNPDEVGITALDDVTLQVELDEASPYFPNLLSSDLTKPVPRHAVEKYGASWTEPDRIVTNGPFRLTSFKPGELMVLDRNPDYHGTFTGNVEQVQVHLGLGDDRLRHLEMYRVGELDILFTFYHLPPEIQKELRGELVDEYRSAPALATWLAGFVLDQPPFDDRRVRRAIAMATDRKTLADVVHRGLVFPATGGFLTPVHAAYSEGIALPYDPARARRLLAQAGYPDGRGFPTIRMVNGHASLSVEANLQSLRDQWHEQLGVNLVWETVWEMGDFLRRMKEDPPHLFFIRWGGKHSDPDDYLRLESSLIWDIARWRDESYFSWVNEARTLADWKQRMALYRQADRHLIEEAVLLPLVYDRSHFLVKPWVSRFIPAAIPRWPFSEVILQPH